MPRPAPSDAPLDQPRNVGDHKALLVVHTHHAQARHQRGKRIVGHLRLGGGHRADEGRFAGVRQAQHAHIGQQQQFQQQVARFTGGTQRLLTRRTVDRRFETGVAQAMPAALGDHQLLLVAGHVAEDLAGALILHARADRHLDDDVFPAFTGTVAALAILAALGAERLLKTVVDQGVEVLVRQQVDVAAVAAVTAVRPTVRDIFFRGGS